MAKRLGVMKSAHSPLFIGAIVIAFGGALVIGKIIGHQKHHGQALNKPSNHGREHVSSNT